MAAGTAWDIPKVLSNLMTVRQKIKQAWEIADSSKTYEDYVTYEACHKSLEQELYSAELAIHVANSQGIDTTTLRLRMLVAEDWLETKILPNLWESTHVGADEPVVTSDGVQRVLYSII